MKISLKQALRSGRVIIGDGGMGTELQKAGLEPGGCGDEWNLIHPERVLAIQRAYVEAGSQLLITNNFGSNRFVLARYELEDKVAALCRAGTKIARQAIGDGGWVLGDVGPCGGFLEPLGDITEEQLAESLRVQIGSLLEESVDGIIFETITALEELRVGIRVARELDAPCIIASLAYDKVRDGYKTMMGVAPEQAARVALEAGADVLGANCGTGIAPAEFVEIAKRYRAVSDAPIMLQPNAGQPLLQGTAVVYPVSPQEIAPMLVELAQHAAVVGACCGSSPAHIGAFRRLLD